MDRGRTSTLQPGDPRKIGDYELVGRIGEGGMGRVFLGRAIGGRLVAVKLIRAELANDEGFRQRFRTEVARARQVPPFCTAEVLDADPDHDPPYLVVEYVDGPSLEDAVTEHGVLSAANLHAVAVNMATALIAIHGAGLVHGDLKPSNVMLAPGSPKVIDFSLARPVDGDGAGTSVRGVVGTVPYMSPERFTGPRGPGLTQAADVFAWAGVVVFAGTGRIPFPGGSAVEIAQSIMNDPPTLTGLTGPLRSLVEEAFAKDPKDRPTARQLLDRLIARSGTVRSPYPGLAAYQESDADLFFGRAELTETLLRRLAGRLTGTGLMVVLGGSGSGKSSLLRAGLLASLDRDLPGVAGSGTWPRLRLTPGRYPVRQLAAEVARLAGIPGGAVQDEIFADPRRFPIHVLQALRAVAERATANGVARTDAVEPRPRRPRLILVVDQFEELFTVCDQETERHAFIGALRAAAGTDEHDQTALVVLGVRADFYARLASYSTLAPLLEQNTTVGPMNHEQLRAAIEEPARRTGLTLEPGLVEVLLRDIGATPPGQPSMSDEAYPAGTLPLLSHALRATWNRREGQVLSLAGYRATGGVQGAIAASAEEVYSSLDDDGRTALRRLLLQLVRVGEGVEPTRQRVGIADLTADGGPAGGTVLLLDRLAADRLITVDQATAQITHEALLRAWPRLRAWIDEDRAGLLVRQRLTDAAQAWEREHRDPGGLYRGTRLSLAREYLHGARERELTPLARSFLAASVEQELAEQRALRRRARRRAVVTATLAVLLVITAGAAGIALQQRHTATAQQRIATSRALMFEAESLRDRAPANALRMGLAALSVSSGPQTRSSLVRTLAMSRYAGTLTGVESAALASGRNLALTTRGKDKTATLWELTNGASRRRLATLTGQSGYLGRATLTPDGRIALTAENDAVLVWDLSDPSRPRRTATLTGHSDGVGALALSADGRIVLVGGLDKGTATVWDLSRRAEPRRAATLTGNQGWVSVALSQDGRTALTAGGSGTTAVSWDLSRPAAPRRVATLTGHTTHVTSVALNEDGTRALTGSTGGIALVWDLRAAGRSVSPVARLAAHTGWVHAVALNSNGTMALTGSRDGTAVVWDLRDAANPRHMSTLTGHSYPVVATELAADASTALTVDAEGTAIVWNMDIFPERRAIGWLTGRHDGERVVALRPDGRAALTGGSDGKAILWDVSDPTRPRPTGTLAGHTGTIHAVAWRPDGRAALTGGADATAILWDASDVAKPRSRARLTGHQGEVGSVAWRPDGRTALTASADGRVLVWDVDRAATPRQVANLSGHAGGVHHVAIGSDGQTALTGGEDGTAILWDITTPARPSRVATLTEHARDVMSVAMSHDGRFALTGGIHGDAILYDIAPFTGIIKDPVNQACAIVGHGLSRQEWSERVPGVPYRDTCPG